ncbi:MAG TPA: hypothetical protein VKB69_01100 [Micromonosporaceae bacterium]|nr:hypothetical protein [Micromonosporaceae bacterium]
MPERGDDARLALQDIARDYGPSGLDNPKVFAQVLPDLLAGAPLATNLLNAAAAAGVGRMLTERIAASIPIDAAVRDVGTLLSQRSALDVAAAQWVVAEYARVLGHPVSEGWQAAQPVSGQPGPTQAVPMQGVPTQGVPMQGVPTQAVPTQALSGWPASGQPVSGQPVSGQPVSGQPVSGQPVASPAAGGIPPGGGMSAAGAGEPAATQLDGGAPGQPGQPGAGQQPTRVSGRAAAVVQPNRGRVLDDTTPFPVTSPAQGYPPSYPQQQPYPPQQPPYPPQPAYPQAGFPQGGYGPYGQVAPPVKRSKAPWIAGGVVLLLVIGAVVAIVLISGQKKSCSGASCRTQPTHGPTVPVTPTTKPPTTPTTLPPQAPLAQLMPKDVDVTACGPDTQNADLMDNVTTSLACNEGASSTLPGAAVLGYQFSNVQDYNAGLAKLNDNTGIDPSTASDQCPPASGHDTGVNTWHRGSDANAPVLGKLECFTDSDDYNYFIWTSDSELTIEIVKADHGQTFDQINTWWGTNNNNSTGG